MKIVSFRLPLVIALLAGAAPTLATVPRTGAAQRQAVRVSRAQILEAMRPELDYDAAMTANSGRFQAHVYLRLGRDVQSSTDADLVLINHEDWYQAFLEYAGLTDDEAPEFLRLIRAHRQDAWLDIRPDAVIREIREGRAPEFAMNVRLAFAADDKADSFSYEDRLADPAVLVHNDRVVTFRLMDLGNQVFHDDISGSKVRPLTGSLGALFAVIGLAEIRSVRMAVADDGTAVSIGTARKALVSVPAAVTTSPWGRSERGVSPLRDDLLELEQRLREPIDYEYQDVDWDRLVASTRTLGGQTVPITVEFIGNMALRLSDGVDTLFTDFPYESGAHGYMIYPDSELDDLPVAATLISHDHADHWDAAAFAETSLQLIAAPAIAATVDPERVIPWGDSIVYGAIEVQPVPTPHIENHMSYRVLWDGHRLYFTGDTDDATSLLAERDLDVAFVSPWLLRAVLEAGQEIDAELVVVYHHADREVVPLGPGIHVPTQRSSFVIR